MAIIEELEKALDDIEEHGGTAEYVMKLASIAYEMGKSEQWLQLFRNCKMKFLYRILLLPPGQHLNFNRVTEKNSK